MMQRLDRLPFVLAFVLALVGATAALADQEGSGTQAEKQLYTEGLDGVDFTGMTPAQKALALKILNDSGCDCGCGMTVAQCRVEDQNCPRSPLLARAIVDAVRRGGDEESARAAYRTAIGGDRTPRTTTGELPIFDIEVGDSPIRGAASAPVTIVEFSDFQCPFCFRALPAVQQILDLYPDRVRLVFKHFPLPIHSGARAAAIAAEAAREQGKFWEMHDVLFRHPGALERAQLVGHAGKLGLDVVRFEADLDSDELAARVDRDAREAVRVGATGTPTFYVNGKRLRNYQVNAFRQAIERTLATAGTSGR